MRAPEETFQSYLRGEVESAGKRYDQAVERLLTLLGAPNTQPGPELAGAVESLSENLRLYSGAIRRMASFAGRPQRIEPRTLVASACSRS